MSEDGWRPSEQISAIYTKVIIPLRKKGSNGSSTTGSGCPKTNIGTNTWSSTSVGVGSVHCCSEEEADDGLACELKPSFGPEARKKYSGLRQFTRSASGVSIGCCHECGFKYPARDEQLQTNRSTRYCCSDDEDQSCCSESQPKEDNNSSSCFCNPCTLIISALICFCIVLVLVFLIIALGGIAAVVFMEEPEGTSDRSVEDNLVEYDYQYLPLSAQLNKKAPVAKVQLRDPWYPKAKNMTRHAINYVPEPEEKQKPKQKIMTAPLPVPKPEPPIPSKQRTTPIRIMAYYVDKQIPSENVLDAITSEMVKNDLVVLIGLVKAPEELLRGFMKSIHLKDQHLWKQYITKSVGPNQEKYGVLHRKNITVSHIVLFKDSSVRFVYSPLALRIVAGGVPPMTAIFVHLASRHEVQRLPSVAEASKRHHQTKDVVILGNIEGELDCHAQLSNLLPDYVWLIPDNADTTVDSSSCAHDRILIQGDYLQSRSLYAVIHPLDIEYPINDRKLMQFSSHYPVSFQVE